MIDGSLKAIVDGLRWAAEGFSSGRLTIISVQHEREIKEDPMGNLVDTTIRTFHLRYRVNHGPLTIGEKEDVDQRPEDSFRRVPFI
jgi:hypothetical protein